MDLAPPVRRPWRLDETGRAWFDRCLVAALLLPVPVVAFADLTYAVLAAAQSLPLLWRRTHPVACFLAVGVASAAQLPLMELPIYSQLAFPLAVYAVARYAPARPGLGALLIGLVAAAVGAVDWLRGYDLTIRPGTFLPYLIPTAAFVVTAWALGVLGRTREAYVDALVERADRIEREAEQRIGLAAAEERARVARDMHDVVAHGLSTIVVQADGARYATAADPAAATETLRTIAATGRDSLTEMRRLLGLLREDGGGLRPQPRLPDIRDLVTAGGVDHRLSGLERQVPDGVALTAYRVVQESLTNVRKHAGPSAGASVSVTVTDRCVEVDVLDDGRGAAARDAGGGLGLLGMRERVQAHDGELETGPRPGGGFRVRARIPL